MFLKVKVFPQSKKEEIIQKSKDSFVIKVKAKPIEGMANQKARELLADYLNLSFKQIRIIQGRQQRNKIIQIIS